MQLYREAKAVREKVDAALERVVKSSGDAWRSELGKASPAYRDTHDAILAALGLAQAESAPRTPGEAAKALEAMLSQAEADAAVVAFDVDAIRELVTSPRKWAELTPNEVFNVVDAVTNIRRVANLRNEVTLLDKRTTLTDVLDEMARAASVLPAQPKGSRSADAEGAGAVLRRGRQGVAASLLSIESIAHMLDGGREDGVFRRVFVDGYLKARNYENDLARQYGKVIADAWEKAPGLKKGRLHELVDLSEDLPLAPALLDSAWRRDDAVPRSYVVLLALNMGNEGRRSNKQRLLDGYGWSESQVLRALGKHLNRAELNFVQGVWNSLEGLYPLIEALQERDSGLKPGKIARWPLVVELADGSQWRGEGGYFPAKYDPRPGMSKRGAAFQERDIAAILDPSARYPATLRGHTKERAEAVTDVINLSWSVYPSHVLQVLHDLSFREYVRQTAAIVVDSSFEGTVTRALGEGYTSQFRPWLQELGSNRADAVRSDVRQFFGLAMFLKSRAVISAMGHNLANALGDLANPLLVVGHGDVRPDYMARASAQLTPLFSRIETHSLVAKEAWDFAIKSSPELQHRRQHGTEFLRRQLDGIGGEAGQPNLLQRSGITRPLGNLVKSAQATAFFAQEILDKLTSTQVWYGAYLQNRDAALKSGRPDEHTYAVRAADAVVRKFFPAESLAERPSIMRARLLAPWLVFYGFYTKVHNTRRLDFFDARMTLIDKTLTPLEKTWKLARIAGGHLGMTYALAASDLFSGRGPEQEDDSWADWLRRKSASGQVIDWAFIGAPLASLIEKLMGGNVRVNVRAAPGLALGENAIRHLGRAIDEGTPRDEAFWATFGLAGLGLGAPTLGVSRPGRYLTSGEATEDLGAGRPEDLVSGALYGEQADQPLNPITAVRATVEGRVPLVKP